MKMKNFILYKILKKIIVLINEIIREFNEKDFETIKRIFEYENYKKNLKSFKEFE